MDLKDLLDAVTGASDDAAARQQAVRDALAAGENLDLVVLEQAAAVKFAELSEPGDAGFTDEQIAQMGAIADVVDALRAEATAQETAARAAELTTRIGQPSIQAPRPIAPAPEPEPEPVPEPPAVDITEPAGSTVDEPPAVVDGGVEQQPEPALAAAAGKTVATRPKNTVPLAPLPKQLPPHMQATFTLTAAADIPGYPMGSILDGIDGLTKAAMARMQALARAGKDTTAGIAVLEREQPDEKLIATRPDDYEVVAYACDERRLPGGNLIAAAGWCAPPEQIYDQFCPLPVVDGLVSLPTITARRGGITWPVTPDFSQIYSNTGFFMPIEEMNKGENPDVPADYRRDKPCYLVQCTDHQTVVLDVYGICVKVPILHERAYPELVSYVMQQIMAAHAHKMNAVALREMETLATTKVTLPPIADAGNAYGPGATPTLLGMIELQVEYLRYRYRLGMGATMEMVAPAFIKGILRSDLAKRNGVDMLTVNDAQLNAHMTARGVSIQYVLDWQDAFAGPNQGGMGVPDPDPPPPPPTPPKNKDMTWLPTWDSSLWGGNTPPTAWPLNVTILIYPAGTYFKLTNDIISLDGLFDSTLLARNLHLAVFSEEGQKIALRGCYDPLAITMPLCPNGATGVQRPVICATGAA